MSDYLESLEKKADVLLKEHPDEIDKLASELEKTMEECKKKGRDFDFYDLLHLFIKSEQAKNATPKITS